MKQENSTPKGVRKQLDHPKTYHSTNGMFLSTSSSLLLFPEELLKSSQLHSKDKMPLLEFFNQFTSPIF